MTRYELRTGEFGQYFYDLQYNKALPLSEVLGRLEYSHNLEKDVTRLQRVEQGLPPSGAAKHAPKGKH
jgi:hypothetical protein